MLKEYGVLQKQPRAEAAIETGLAAWKIMVFFQRLGRLQRKADTVG